MIRIDDYKSPEHEASLYKGIPIAMYDKCFMRLLSIWVGKPLRVKFRGPRRHRRSHIAHSWKNHQSQSYCLKADARTFAVYVK